MHQPKKCKKKETQEVAASTLLLCHPRCKPRRSLLHPFCTMSNLVWSRVKLVSNIWLKFSSNVLIYLFPPFSFPSIPCLNLTILYPRIPEEASYLSDEQSSNLIQINDQYEK